MDEFERKYEYFEEKRGLILLFFFMLILIDLYQAPFYILPLHEYFRQNAIIDIGYMAISAVFVLFILLTAWSCFKINKKVVMISKIYLIVRLVFFEASVITLFVLDVWGMSMRIIRRLFLPRLVLPIVFELLFTSFWLLYFIKSKHSRELAKNQDE